MELTLTKGMQINLTKEIDLLSDISIILSWDRSKVTQNFDADLTLVELQHKGYDADGQPVMNILGEDVNNLLFYNNKTGQTVDGAFKHSGDEQNGGTETVDGNLDIVNPLCSQIDVVGTIHEGLARGQSWGNLNARITLRNNKTGENIAHYDLKNDFEGDTAVQFGSFERKDGNWIWTTVGLGFKNGLQSFVEIWTEKPVTPV